MSELYKLPDGWVWKKLGTVLNVQNGYAFDSKLFSEETGVQLIRIRDLKNGFKTVSKFTGSYDKKFIVRKNDFLIGMDGDFVCYQWKGENSLLNQRVCRLIDFDFSLNANYIFYGINKFLDDIHKITAFVTVKHISSKQIKEINFPIPPLKEQKRIVSKLDTLFDKIDKSIALHVENIKDADAFMGSVLNETFTELEEKYTTSPLFEVADVSRGKSKHRPRNDKRLFGGKYPFIQTGNVRNADKYITTYTNTYSEFGLAQSKLWKKGTICMTIAANIGDVAILGMDSCFPDSVVGLYSEKNSNDYLYFFLQTLKQHLESKATTTAQMNINLKVLQTIAVPLPSLLEQEKIVEYLNEMFEKVETLKSVQKEKMESLVALKASILDKAFRGEL